MKFKSLLSLFLVVVMAVCGSTCTAFAADAAPKATTVNKYALSGTTLNVEWKKISDVDGYEIQYANNRFFMNSTSVMVKDEEATSKKINNVSAGTVYVRIRSYVASDEDSDKVTKSSWALSSNCRMNKTASLTKIMKADKKKRFELRGAAGQSVGKYDTLQGGVTYGTYGWFILYNRNVSKCKIVKMNMKTKKIVKKSGELKISHGNDMAYNPDRKQLVVAHGPSNYKLVSIVDPDTLEIKKTFSLTLPKGTPGASDSRCKSFSGITAIAYNNAHNMYVVRLKSQGNLVYYDQDFKAKKYVSVDRTDGQLYQGMDTYSDYIMVIQSPYNGGRYNIISVYDWKGKYLSKVSLNKSYEIECLFHRNGNLYAGYYRSYYKTYYLDGFKIKVVNGKKNQVKTRFKKTKLMRDNYFYKVTSL